MKLNKKEREILRRELQYKRSIDDGFDKDTKYIVSALTKILKSKEVKSSK